MTFDLGTNGVVAVRDSQGEIRAFHNVCRHRGARILDGIGHCPGAINCPYHGWSYRLNGELRAVTERDSFPGLERSQWGLKPVRSQVAFGFVFVCLEGEPPPVEEVWGELARELAPYRIAEMQPLGPMYIEHWDCDWKIAMDNYLESYHVPIGHPGLFRMFSPDYEDQVLLPGGVARGISYLRDQPSSRWSERFYQKLVVPTAVELAEEKRRRWSFYSMLPNIGIDIFPEQMDFFQVLPRGPASARSAAAPSRIRTHGARCACCVISARGSTGRYSGRTSSSAPGCSAGSARAPTSPARSRVWRAACCSSTTCCAAGFPRCASRTRPRVSPKGAYSSSAREAATAWRPSA